MGSSSTGQADERNAGFGPSRLQEAKPGYEAAGGQGEERSDLHHRRSPSDEKDVPRTSLAERIREDRDTKAS